MAKVLFTAIVAEMRNKLNGNVFSKNRGGNYLRNKVTPVNPNTTYQADQRATLSAHSAGWRGLTQAQRDAWNDAAASFPYTDIFGNVKILSGQQLYVKLNTNLSNIGEANISDPPTPVAVPLVTPTAATAAAGGAKTVTISPATVPTGYTLVVWASPSVSPGISFMKNKVRFLGEFTVTSGVATITTAYNARFGDVVAGQKVEFRTVLISNDSGQQGVPSSIQIIAT